MTKNNIKHGTTNRGSFQKEEKVESSSQDWVNEPCTGTFNGFHYCAACGKSYAESYISRLLTLKEREVVDNILEWAKKESKATYVMTVADLVDFLNKEYKLKGGENDS